MADRRVRVILAAEIADFQNKMRQSQAELGQVAQNADRGEKRMAGMGTTIMGRVIPAVAGLVAGWQTFDKVFKAGFDRLSNLEDANKRLEQMGLTTGQITTLMDGLNDTLIDTPFRLDDGAGAIARFVSAGMPIGDINRNFELMADTAAFAQAPLNELTEIWERIQTEGRLTGETLRMLQVRGVPALELLASAAGVSSTRMREMISSGEVDAGRFFDLWETGAQGFGDANIVMAGAAKSMGDTTSGALANAGTALGRLGAKILETTGLFDGIGDSARGAREGVNALISGIESIEQATEKTGLQKLTDWIKDLNMSGGEAIQFTQDWEESASDWNRTGFDWIERLKGVFTGTEEVRGSTEHSAEAIAAWESSARVAQGSADKLERQLDGTATATAGASDAAERYAEMLAHAAEQTDRAITALSEYQAELKASTDPVFALVSALEKVDEAEEAVAKARKKHGESSAEATEAEWALFQALVSADSAAHNSGLSFEGLNAVLDDYVAQGLLTEGAASRIRDRIGEAREAAEDYQGPYTAELLAEIDDPKIRDAQRRLDAVARARNPQYRAELDRQQEIQARNRLNALATTRRPNYRPQIDSAARARVLGALAGLAATRNVTIRPVIQSLSNRALMHHLGGGHTGGRVTRSGVMPRMHSGGEVTAGMRTGVTLGGRSLAGDEVPVVLQTRERVLSREQNQAFERLMGIMGRSSSAGPFFHAGGVVGSGSGGASGAVGQPRVVLEVRGAGGLYDAINYGLRTHQINIKTEAIR